MTDLTDKLAGEVIRNARQARKYTYRRMEMLSEELAQREPDRFEKVSKTVLWNMETGGEKFFLQRAVSPGKLRSLIELLFSGDHAKFARETGLTVLDVMTDGGPTERMSLDVPMFLEMEAVGNISRTVLAPVSCDFVIEVRTGRMHPVLAQGQALYCIRADRAQPGELAVLDLPEEGLTVATALAGGRFRFERTQREFALVDGGRVHGVVSWLKPVVPV
ncbi:hypothetical protein [Deinococcus radiotolerans]|uniref:Uncharacterized protein n=1 Tax=Deinococcus radiotolerans TaxID=1309407 RepID=A0ABQ2FQ05_9DEIO|nr:hypothetical protein [Deinococcus radiotolerans]GGL15584.1 hypothetical protein GCM10010844_38100 [Deinococcus radiotolerans]